MNFDTRWKGIAHQQIWDWVHAGSGAKSSANTERSLDSMNKALINSVTAVSKVLDKTGEAWKGEAAAKASAGMQSLRHYTDGLRQTSYKSRYSATGQAGTSDWARKAVPPVQNAGLRPAQPTGNPGADVLQQTQDWQAREAQAKNAEQRAQEVMEQHTSNTRYRLSSMPVVPPVPKIVLNTETAPPPPPPPGPPIPPRVRDPRGGSGGGGRSYGGGGTGGSEITNNGNGGGDDGQGQPEERPGDRDVVKPGPGPQPGPDFRPGPPPDRSELVWGDDPERVPGGGVSTGGGSSESGGVGGGGLIGAGGLGGASGGAGGGTAPGETHGGQSRGAVGMPGAVAPGTAGAEAARAAGTAGQQGFMQPASGAQREEDQEHQRKYWVPGSDLFDDDRLVAPPVIGEEY